IKSFKYLVRTASVLSPFIASAVSQLVHEQRLLTDIRRVILERRKDEILHADRNQNRRRSNKKLVYQRPSHNLQNITKSILARNTILK
ncbi:MAG: hypothetical protein ACOCTK_02755, partial [Candidatus Saliniplasma sp.]